MRRLAESITLLCLLLLAHTVSYATEAHADEAHATDASKPKPPKLPKVHAVALGAGKKVPYSKEGDPAGASATEKELRVRPLVVDGKVKEWTAGDSHDVTDRSFAIRRAIRVNDALPTDKTEHWVWQKGPWLLHLPDYDPGVSDVAWFRDYAAYCGLTAGGRQLYAVVAQVAARKPLVAKKLKPWDPLDHPSPACEPAAWQRDPLQITFQPTGGPVARFEVVGLSAVLVEDSDSAPAPQPDPVLKPEPKPEPAPKPE
jgi:hypothetical protein